jgi:hypothetical protein
VPVLVTLADKTSPFAKVDRNAFKSGKFADEVPPVT